MQPPTSTVGDGGRAGTQESDRTERTRHHRPRLRPGVRISGDDRGRFAWLARGSTAADPYPLKAALRGDVTLPADPVVDPNPSIRSIVPAVAPPRAKRPNREPAPTPTSGVDAHPRPQSSPRLRQAAAPSTSAPLHRTEIVVAAPTRPAGVQTQLRRSRTAAPAIRPAAPQNVPRGAQAITTPPATAPTGPDRTNSDAPNANGPTGTRSTTASTANAPLRRDAPRPRNAAGVGSRSTTRVLARDPHATSVADDQDACCRRGAAVRVRIAVTRIDRRGRAGARRADPPAST